MSHSQAALIVAGHGSTVNADSSDPTYQHAETIRRTGRFAEVVECFWKEEPNFRQALRMVQSRQVYVVPNFISSGYFTEEIIPRELGLDGPRTLQGDREVFYCDPVGLHPSMTEVLLHRAAEVVQASGQELRDNGQSTCLFIIGHGTGLNENSTRIIAEQVRLISERGIYGECQQAYMEQAPFIKDWRTLTALPDVIAVPFFIADGLHSYEDIPVLLGMTANVRESSVVNPQIMDGRRLWYARAIGTDSSMADVILAQVEKFDRDYVR